MINTIKLRAGRTAGATAVEFNATSVTVFVGPNNSGKSRVLAEIEQFCRSGAPDPNTKVLDELSLTSIKENEITDALERLRLIPNPNESIRPDNILIGSRHGRQLASIEQIRTVLQNVNSNKAYYCQCFLTHKTLMLNGQSRIGLVETQAAGDLQQSPQTSLQLLFRDDVKRAEVRRIIFDAFGTHFVIDPTNLGSLRIRLATKPPSSPMQERGIHEEAVQFHAAAPPISTASDGTKAFTGIITEVMAGDPSIILIDEPEAFLHPSLATKLGIEVSRAALSSNKRLLVSTHSPAFLMGCIQSNAPINIVRLTYRDGFATTRILPSSEILELMRHPLLRSTGVLSGLFYEFVVVTESDADRAFYQEINERLLHLKPEWGIPNCLFINAQNKQTIPTIIQPLRKLGIPTAEIVDIDVVKDGGSTWTKVLTSAGVPELAHASLATIRTAIKDAMAKTGKNMKTDGGIEILDSDSQEAAKGLLDQLASYGVFVVPGGELESWLKHLSIPGHGPNWLVPMFERMGEDPTLPSYEKPSETDVWLFLAEIRKWLVNPKRKGIPV